MKFAVESWDPSYGTNGDEQTLIEADNTVDAGQEVPLDEWAPIRPDPPLVPPESITFIDGVRRIDARVWVTDPDDGTAHPGVCATVAAGAVRCVPGSAKLTDSVIERALYTAAPDAGPIVTRFGTYGLRPLTGGDPDALYFAIHSHMTAVETSLSATIDAGSLIVFDGPLRGRDSIAGVGYVKTHNVQYLPTEQHRVVGELGEGERTPVFLIGGRFTKWSWYLRLPGPISHPLSGVVRLELPGVGTADDAADRANTVSSLLPKYASEPHKDTRAPQNLHPIAGLERELRRRLGDPRLLEKALRQSAF